MTYPDWVEKHRLQGCEIKNINGKYYLYRLKSRWDPDKKRSVKITGEYLGAITEAGFIPKRVKVNNADIYVIKEYGASAYLMSISEDIRRILNGVFDKRTADSIYVSAILRLIGEQSFKRLEHASYITSYISETIPDLSLKGPSATALLEFIGRRRDRITEIMRELSSCAINIIIDGSRITSFSKQMMMPQVGYGHGTDWDPQINLIYVFERAPLPQPVFYRCVQGNISDVTAMKLTIESMEREGEFTVVADKGFAKETNYGLLTQYGMKYIIPLKRNSAEFSAEKLGNRSNFTTAFTYNKRPVIAYQVNRENYQVIAFRDEDMKAHEMSDFISKLEKKIKPSVKRKKRQMKLNPILGLRP